MSVTVYWCLQNISYGNLKLHILYFCCIQNYGKEFCYKVSKITLRNNVTVSLIEQNLYKEKRENENAIIIH